MKNLHGAVEHWKRVRKDMLGQFAELDQDAEALVDTIEGETDLRPEVLIVKVIERALLMGHLSMVAKHRATELAARAARFSAGEESLRTLALQIMDMASIQKLEEADFTVSRKKLPQGLLVTEESEIPSEYFEPRPAKLDRKALLKALKEGILIEGAGLTNPSETIQIRTS